MIETWIVVGLVAFALVLPVLVFFVAYAFYKGKYRAVNEAQEPKDYLDHNYECNHCDCEDEE